MINSRISRHALTSQAIVVTALVAVIAGCTSSDDPDTSGGAPSSAVTTTGESSATSSEPQHDSPPAFPSGSPEASSLDEIEETHVVLEGGGGPDWLAAGFGSLWARRDNAVLERLSADGAIEATIDAGIWQQPVCQGLGVTDDAVWACATEGKLMRVDPKTNEVAAIVPIPKVNEQGRLPFYDGRVWVLTGDGDELVPVSEQTDKPGTGIPLDAFCTDVADRVVGSTLWVVCPYENAALSVDLDAGEVTARVKGMTKVKAVSADDDVVWVCTQRGVVQIDPTTTDVMGIQHLPVGLYCTVRLDGDVLWVRAGSRNSFFVTGVDAASGEVVQTITAPGDTAGGDIVEFDGSLWASSFEEGRVYEMRPPVL